MLVYFLTMILLAQKLFDAGQVVGEQLWRLPMGESYDREIDSEIADVKNVGSGKGGVV